MLMFMLSGGVNRPGSSQGRPAAALAEKVMFVAGRHMLGRIALCNDWMPWLLLLLEKKEISGGWRMEQVVA